MLTFALLSSSAWLKTLANVRTDLRVRVNPTNQGAPFTRKVGMKESAAEFILFLDDDVIPDPHVIDRYVEALRAHGAEHDGFVGYSELPAMPGQIFPTAVQVSFFWRAASKMKLMPWGITANLFVRRAACPRFDLRYIKTGGGEDIDFYLKLFRQPLLSVPEAKVLHPWWDNGQRCYKHFFNWSQSDGMLQDVYPHLTVPVLPRCDGVFLPRSEHRSDVPATLLGAASCGHSGGRRGDGSVRPSVGCRCRTVLVRLHPSAGYPGIHTYQEHLLCAAYAGALDAWQAVEQLLQALRLVLWHE